MNGTAYLSLASDEWLTGRVPEFASWEAHMNPQYGGFWGTDPAGPRSDVNQSAVISVRYAQSDGKLLLHHFDGTETRLFPGEPFWFAAL